MNVISTDNAYRFTPTSSGGIIITAADHGSDAMLRSPAAQLFQALERGEGLALQGQHGKFLETARSAGWVDDALHLRGVLSPEPRANQLKRVQIELSVRCNFKCLYCYSESGPTQAAALDVCKVKSILDDAHRMGVTWIDFTGGEVLIYKEWDTVVAHARNLGLIVSVHSNGLLLTERNVRRLTELRIRTLQVTVESHHAEVHESVGRGSRLSHQRVLDGLRRAQEAGINVRLAALVHRKNIDHIADSVRWFHDQFGTPLSLDRVMATGVEGATPLAVSESEFWEAVSPLLGTGTASAGRICDPLTQANTPVEPECGVAHSFVYVTADGHFSLCPTMTHREEEQFDGPTTDQMGLETAWEQSDLFNRFRGLNCENVGVCPAASTCGGGCRSNAYLETGRLTAPDSISCNTHKNPNKTYVNFLGRYDSGIFTPVSVEEIIS